MMAAQPQRIGHLKSIFVRKVKVVSKKYDGSLRDEYQIYLYAETDETITLFSPPGLKYRDHRKAAWFEAQDGLVEIYFKHKWYNVWHICEQVSHTNLIYVNISMPTTFFATGIKWIDLDLDYRVHLNHSVERLDQAEFEQNAQSMRYPPDLILQAHIACQEVEAGLVSRVYPFDYEQQVELYHQIKADLLTR
jgi:protein associated with RNAse G/E